MTRHERIEVINKYLLKLDDEGLEGPIALLSKIPASPVMDEETSAWHDSDVSKLAEYEAYDWGDIDPLTYGKPVRLAKQGRSNE